MHRIPDFFGIPEDEARIRWSGQVIHRRCPLAAIVNEHHRLVNKVQSGRSCKEVRELRGVVDKGHESGFLVQDDWSSLFIVTDKTILQPSRIRVSVISITIICAKPSVYIKYEPARVISAWRRGYRTCFMLTVSSLS